MSSSIDLPEGYHKHPNLSIAYKLHHEMKSFGDALRICESEGAKLAVPLSIIDFDYIKSVYANPGITIILKFKIIFKLNTYIYSL